MRRRFSMPSFCHAIAIDVACRAAAAAATPPCADTCFSPKIRFDAVPAAAGFAA